MKQKLLFLTFATCSLLNMNAQVTDVVSGLFGAYDLLLDGDDLYVASYDNNRVNKIDISLGMPVVEDVVIGSDGANGLALNGNDLYISEYDANQIIKIDITAPFPAPRDTVLTNIGGPVGLRIIGNDMYVAAYNDGQIIRIDISSPIPIASRDTIVTGQTSINSFELDGNFLYYSEDGFGANQVSRIDLTLPIPITPQLLVPPANILGPRGLQIIGTDLYITESQSGEISKIDLTGSFPTIPTTAFTTAASSGPADIIFDGEYMYVGEQVSGKITRIRLLPDEPTLSVSLDTICIGDTTFINVASSDTLNAGTNWFLYADDLMNSPIDSSLTGSFTILGTVTTNYIVRGEGVGLIGEPDTATVTVKVLMAPDQPTLAASSNTVCVGESITIDISASDSLNAGSNWFLYLDDLSGTAIDSSLLGNFTIMTPATGDYIVRGEGNGLIGIADTVSVVVNALPNVAVTQSIDSLLAVTGNFSYEWIDCSNNSSIIGATSSFYLPIATGDYQVVVTDLTTTCFDTSVCVNVIISGVAELEEAIKFDVYPNPSNGDFTINLPDNQTVNLEIFNHVGQKVFAKQQLNGKEDFRLSGIEGGLYIIKLTSTDGREVFRKILIR